jgi:hypothetical protein
MPLFLFYRITSRRNTGQGKKVLRFFISTLIAACVASTASGDTLSVFGTVTKEGSAVVIRNALVVVTMGSASGIDKIDSVRTDALGRYFLVATSVSQKVRIQVTATGFQPSENTVNVAAPADGITDRIVANFSLRTVTPSDTVRIYGVMADASTRAPLADAWIIAIGNAGAGGAIVNDTVTSGANGNFFMLLPDKNHYYPSLLVEKNGYRSTVRQLSTTSSNIQLDTIFLFKLTTMDSITYSVSGAVADTHETGIRGAVVTVRISNGAALLYTGKDTTTQWGGYYLVRTKQRYGAGLITVEVLVEKTGYFSKDTTQTMPSSTPDAVVNVVLWPTGAGVLPRGASAGMVSLVNKQSARLYTIDGRYAGQFRPDMIKGRASGVFIVERNGVMTREYLRVK